MSLHAVGATCIYKFRFFSLLFDMRALKSFFIFADSVPRIILVEWFRSIKSFQIDMRLASQIRRII